VRERGLDHTKLVAGELARITGWRESCMLVRQNDGLQRGKSKTERKKQAKNMFTTGVEAAKITHFDTVVLYDDITTTGATLAECARLLRENGAKNVRCIVLAKTR
jgi:ComF family protein